MKSNIETIRERLEAADVSTWKHVYSFAHPHGDDHHKDLWQKRLAVLVHAPADIGALLGEIDRLTEALGRQSRSGNPGVPEPEGGL